MLARAIKPYLACLTTIAALTSVLGGAACREEHTATGIRLTIGYGDEAPTWLHIAGTSEDGRLYGPSLVPDPPRPLAQHRETVLLMLPDEMDGVVLSLSIAGLNARRSVQMSGFVPIEVVRHTIQSAFVSLTSRPSSVDPDAGMTIGAGTTDAGAIVEERTTSPDPIRTDAAVLKPEPMPEPMPTPEPTPMPEPTPDPEPCANGACAIQLQCEGTEPTCDLKCPGDAHCAYDCGRAEECKPSCKNATCQIDCSDAHRCRPTCEGHADCEITCGEGTACTEVTCRAEARCLVHCEDDDCQVSCEGDGELVDCGNGVFACNRECPDDSSETTESD